jgi:hypothetical protein
MFTWHGEPAPEEYNADPSSAPPSPAMLGAYVRIQLSDHFAAVEDLLGMPATYGKPVGPVPIGECLVNFALDLAAGSPTYRGSFDERRATLRKTIVVVSAGTRSVR